MLRQKWREPYPPTGPRLKALLQDALAARGAAPTVLVNEYGQPWKPGTLTVRFRQASEHALMERLGPHVLRHTFASRLVMSGVDLKTVQELMGHKDINMTLRYAHLSPDHKRAAMETLESRFSANSPAHIHNTPSTPLPQEHIKVAMVR